VDDEEEKKGGGGVGVCGCGGVRVCWVSSSCVHANTIIKHIINTSALLEWDFLLKQGTIFSFGLQSKKHYSPSPRILKVCPIVCTHSHP